MKEMDDAITERIRQIVGKTLDVEPDTLRLTDPVCGPEDSSADGPHSGILGGLYWIEVNSAVEEEFHLEISEQDMVMLYTIADYANYVRRRQAGLPPFEEKPTTSARRKTAQKKSPSPPEPPRQEDDALLAWKFHQGHWERTDDPLQMEEEEPSYNVAQTLQQAGYKPSPILRVGKQGQSMHAEVYVKEHKGGHEAQHYYVRLWLGSEIESIYVSNLPSLIALLHRLGPIIASSQGTE